MQPYTPHGDSNFLLGALICEEEDATLYPSRGQ